MTRKLTTEEKQTIAKHMETMDSVKVTIVADGRNNEGRFLIENGTSHLPAQRLSRRLERRGCKIELVGNSKQRIIRFPAVTL